MPITHRYDFPDRFVSGTVGEPGNRTFFVQARKGNKMTNVVVEKQQVQVLAEHLERVLDELEQLADISIQIPPARSVARDLGPLDAPLDEDFRAGTMTIAWDANVDALRIELFSLVTSDDDEAESDDGDLFTDPAEGAGEALEVRITPEQARDFVARSRSLVVAGRPACPFCGQPIDPGGHICPRSNGYRTPLFTPGEPD